MAKRFIIALILISVSSLAAGQGLDTLELEEVLVRASSLENYGIGGKQQDMSDELEGIYGGADLTTLLQSATPVYLRQLGAYGQTSSISFRGTGAGHTAVFWNGININSLTLGQSDFSQIPLFAADDMILSYGSGAALMGTDAIGGAVHISTGNQAYTGNRFEFNQELGSFGLNRTFLTFQAGSPKWQSQTKLYYAYVRNDFEARYRDSTYHQNNAMSESMGILQHNSYQINDKNSIKLDFWYHSNDRGLQPKLGDFNNQDNLENQNLRAILGYNFSGKSLNYQLTLGYVRDEQEYNQAESYGTSRWLASGEFDHVLSHKFQYRAGFDLQLIQTLVDTYTEDVEEARMDYYFSATYSPVSRIELSFNMRQTLIDGFESRAAPSLGAEFALLNGPEQSIVLKGILSRVTKSRHSTIATGIREVIRI